jgi:hypothetical protein
LEPSVQQELVPLAQEWQVVQQELALLLPVAAKLES